MAKTFPVRLIYDEPPGYAKGGLVDAALAVRRAGRYGDTEIIHINKAELAELTRQWGPPTINPQTGMPEFFLGGLGKILKKIAPVAGLVANFIPGIGPLASMAIGAATGGLSGGVKGALLGALPGVAGGALGKLGVGGALGKGLPGLFGKAGATAAKVVPQAATAAAGAAPGAPPPAAISPALSTPITAAAATPPPAPAAPPPPQLGGDITVTGGGPLSGPQAAPPAAAAAPTLAQAQAPAPVAPAAPTAPAAPAQTGFWDKKILGIPNKFAIPGIVGGLALAGAFKKPKDVNGPTEEAFFGPRFGTSQLHGASLPSGYNYANYAEGGAVKPRLRASTRGGSDYGVDIPVGDSTLSVDARSNSMRPKSLGLSVSKPVGRGRIDLSAESDSGVKPNRFGAKYTLPFNGGGGVDGEGDGRDDKIDARLSDGEYVMDAESVSMLGNGSSKAGAKALDNLRVNLRKHKGRSLARGKFSARAKAPERYMGGRA